MDINAMDYAQNDFEEICGLGEIFPDIEPYLEEVTNSFDNAKVRSLDFHIEGSDSDSGISGDSVNLFKSLCEGNDKTERKASFQNDFQVNSSSSSSLFSQKLNDSGLVLLRGSNGNKLTKPTFREEDVKKDSLNYKQITPVRIIRNTPINHSASNSVLPSKYLYTNQSIKSESDVCLKDSINYVSTVGSGNKRICIRSVTSNTLKIPSNNSFNFDRPDFSINTQDINNDYDSFTDSSLLGSGCMQSSHHDNQNELAGVFDHNQVDRLIKKQERMIKNRQAASLSRQRKKEYMERLEHKVDQQRKENQFLQNQIADVRDRYCLQEQEHQLLQKELQNWKERCYELEKQRMKVFSLNSRKDDQSKSKVLKTTAASTTLLGLLVFLVFNFNALNSRIMVQNSMYPGSTYPAPSNPNSANRMSRTLLSIFTNKSAGTGRSGSDNGEEEISALFNSSACHWSSESLNSSESRRLSHALNSWGYRYKTEYIKELDTGDKAAKPPQDRRLIKQNRSQANVKRRTNTNQQLEIYNDNNAYKYFDNFINDIGRNPDTLYFVSMHSDNWIYPATATHLKNFSVPKITLLLPADIREKNGHKIMKIDCEVRNFTVLDMKQYSP